MSAVGAGAFCCRYWTRAWYALEIFKGPWKGHNLTNSQTLTHSYDQFKVNYNPTPACTWTEGGN